VQGKSKRARESSREAGRLARVSVHFMPVRFALPLRLSGRLIALALVATGAGFSARVWAEPRAESLHEQRASTLPPPLGDFEARAQRLFDAIVRDDPTQANEVFFPRDAFLLIKAIPDPGRYYDKLHARFERDVHALHKTLGKDARYQRFELSKRGGHVKPGEEGNRLPYWAARHCFLHYRAQGKAQKLELRVLITWQERWYVIHLSEFH
jgi:hypothetical protein